MRRKANVGAEEMMVEKLCPIGRYGEPIGYNSRSSSRAVGSWESEMERARADAEAKRRKLNKPSQQDCLRYSSVETLKLDIATPMKRWILNSTQRVHSLSASTAQVPGLALTFRTLGSDITLRPCAPRPI
jgi:hypothetical protein